jgi:hypothetical protein
MKVKGKMMRRKKKSPLSRRKVKKKKRTRPRFQAQPSGTAKDRQLQVKL